MIGPGMSEKRGGVAPCCSRTVRPASAAHALDMEEVAPSNIH